MSSRPPPQTPIVLSTYWFHEQPDDGPLTRPKYVVVVYYVVLLITYLLTPWSRVLLEKLPGSVASQEIPRIFGTRRFIIT
jgi:hypothetical protein